MQTAFPFWGPFMGDGLDVGLSPDEMRALSLHDRIDLWLRLAERAQADAFAAEQAQLAAAKNWLALADRAEARLTDLLSLVREWHSASAPNPPKS